MLRNLRDLYVDQLLDLYSAEQQILAALPKMADQAKSKELKQAFQEHLRVTERQLERLDRILDGLGIEKEEEICEGIAGIIEEGVSVMQESEDDSVRDAALIAAAQRVEHYEIASYGTARTFAGLLGEDEAEGLLQETLDEESVTDEKLTQIAQSHINEEALQE